MKIIPCVQGDSTWHATRLGRVTASRVKDALAFGKTGVPLKARSDYMMQLLCERLSGEASRHYVTPEMERGMVEEEYAREVYQISNGVDVDLYGIAIHREFDWLAASPDGIVQQTRGVEFKNPTTLNYLMWKLASVLPPEHADQCQTIIDVWELDSLDFFAYDSRLPAHLAEFQVRVWRDDKRIAEIHAGLNTFVQELEDWAGLLNEKWPAPPPEAPAPEDPRGEEWLNVDEAFARLDSEYASAEAVLSEQGGR